MTGFASGPVTIRVPATSANLGPGFDSLGLALSMYDALTGEVVGSGLEVQVSGEGEGVVPLDESHLVVSSMRAGFAALGAEPRGLRLSCRNVIPHARGLGSSSAAIVGGLALARALVTTPTEPMADDDLVALASRIEGHPDNVAPACLGGFTISGTSRGRAYAVRSHVDETIGAVAFVPPDGVETAYARSLLPATVPHAEAAADAGRAALLVAALAGRPDLLWEATRDWLHQEQRRPAMPESLALVDALREDGIAAVVSGAGPTVLALVASPAEAELRLRECPTGWAAHHLAVDRDGVSLVAAGR